MGVRSMMRVLAGLVAALAMAAPAHAAWIRVETDKFIVYGEAGEKAVRDYAAKLDTYDQVLRRFHPGTVDRKPATKVQVYLVRGEDELRRVRPGLRRYTRGFYAAMNEGVFAVATRDSGLGTDDVIFHEYAHHFMLENFPAAYPAWFVEGFAEYFMTAEIKTDEIRIGGFNPARVNGIFQQTWLPMDELLSKTTGETRPERMNAFYSQSWLLMHYMRSDATRAQQLNKAIAGIANGEDPVKAFQGATGMTGAQLTTALRAYRRLQIISLSGKMPEPPAMKVTVLPRSADDMLLDNLRLILASTGRVDADFLAAVRRRAAKYPGDALAETTLARAEFVMGDVAAGEAIMKRRLEANPNSVEDLLLAGTGQMMAGMRNPADRQTRYRAARPLLAKAYQLDNQDFRTLYAYGVARSIEPGYPTDNDLKALIEARYLAPSVMENSFRAGMGLLRRGRREDAAKILAPVINNPHGGQAAARARQLLNQGQIGTVNIEPPKDDDEDEPPAPNPAAPPVG